MLKRRTDLAVEATQLWQEQAGETTQLRGVQARDSVREGYKVTTVRILDESGAQALGKPVGTYITVELDGLLRREEDAFPRAARALAAEPKLLLLDEPAAGMNPQETEELTAFIGEIREKFKITILLIEHHMNLVMGISDRIYVLDFGKLIAHGTPAEIQKNQRVIDAYLGVADDA